MKNTTKALTVFGIISLLAVSLVAAYGFGIGNKFGTLDEEDKEAMKSNMDAIRTAIQEDDYEAWKAAMEEKIAFMQEQITEENFEALKARHAEMQQLKEQYGFKGRGMGMKGNCPMAE